MLDLTFEQLNNAIFTLHKANPVLRRKGLSTIIADPSVLSPSDSHDGKWHLFCHTLFGVHHYTSNDGTNWVHEGKILSRAMRADINLIDGVYHLYYERVQPLPVKALSLVGGKWYSEIYLVKSKDLKTWSAPELVVGDNRVYTHDERGTAISNPFLTKFDGKYRLYFSTGQTFIEDCKFCEPTYVSYSESDFPDKDFIPLETPLLSPDKDSDYLNLCCGCIKVYQLKDCVIGLQNGIFKGKDNKSHSAIMLLRSTDGKEFDYVKTLLEPQVCEELGDDKNWMKQFVYACNLVHYDGKLWLYFNARDTANPVRGREHIGLFCAEV